MYSYRRPAVKYWGWRTGQDHYIKYLLFKIVTFRRHNGPMVYKIHYTTTCCCVMGLWNITVFYKLKVTRAFLLHLKGISQRLIPHSYAGDLWVGCRSALWHLHCRPQAEGAASNPGMLTSWLDLRRHDSYPHPIPLAKPDFSRTGRDTRKGPCGRGPRGEGQTTFGPKWYGLPQCRWRSWGKTKISPMLKTVYVVGIAWLESHYCFLCWIMRSFIMGIYWIISRLAL